MKHLNPRQGITTRCVVRVGAHRPALGVKHLNPRQGITTEEETARTWRLCVARVKHLNPRQGITTLVHQEYPSTPEEACETPKSPPGDYNKRPLLLPGPGPRLGNPCETPKSPPGDYNRAGRGCTRIRDE